MNKIVTIRELPEVLKELITTETVQVQVKNGVIEISPVIDGEVVEPKTKGKPRHKWSRELSELTFTAELRGGEGRAVWRKAKELVLLAGAKLTAEPQRNKDGSINFSALMAEKLRADHSGQIGDDLITTEDIVFPSPNMLGIFLFYGGQNTWQALKDEKGKSLDEWSQVP